MEKELFKLIVKALKSVYTSPNFLPDTAAIGTWYEMLKDIDATVLQAAVYKYSMTNKFPPTVADLRELCGNIVAGEIPDWSAGWGTVLKCIRKYGYMRETEALREMDDMTRTCVERLGWRELCMSENISIERANFRMMYEQMEARKKDTLYLPEGLLAKIATLSGDNQERGLLNG